jgi:uncharacterized protein (DUF58 family)
MKLEKEVNRTDGFTNIELLARGVVEGFISGLHKSPFHGYSAEFAEHKIYNQGESTKHIDWKLYAKTDKLYTKRYEEETNLRCHLIIDNSASMHYPHVKKLNINSLNKIGFAALASASLMEILQKQRDSVGMSIYSNDYEFYAPEKGSKRHRQMLLNELEQMTLKKPEESGTETYTYLHQIAEKLKRRSLIFLFTDMWQPDVEREKLFQALSHLKYNKHEVVLFHVYDKSSEMDFSFDNAPRRFVDVESGDTLNLYSDNIRNDYREAVKNYFQELKSTCLQYQITYCPVDIKENFNRILTTYLIERQKIG